MAGTSRVCTASREQMTRRLVGEEGEPRHATSDDNQADVQVAHTGNQTNENPRTGNVRAENWKNDGSRLRGPTGRACGDRTTRIIIVIISRHVDRGAHPTNEGAGGHVRYADGQQTHWGRGLGAHNDPRARTGRIHRHTRALTHRRIMMRHVDQGEAGFVRGQAAGEGNWMGKERTIKDDTARGTGRHPPRQVQGAVSGGRRRGDANESQQNNGVQTIESSRN